MLLCVDIGATKTLVAAFTESGELSRQSKFPTAKNYQKFIHDLENILKNRFSDTKFRAGCCAVPGLVDRKNGLAREFGNRPWRNVPIGSDISDIAGIIPVLIESDANLAGLFEAKIFHKKYKKVLYLTISTGIGDAYISDGKIVESLADSEGGHMIILHKGKLQEWEDFASGRALFAKYGRRASEINDPRIWREFVPGIAQGLGQLIATFLPDIVIIGGGLGAHFEKYGDLLQNELEKYRNKMVNIPPVIKAKKPEEAVIYGCYEYIKQNV